LGKIPIATSSVAEMLSVAETDVIRLLSVAEMEVIRLLLRVAIKAAGLTHADLETGDNMITGPWVSLIPNLSLSLTVKPSRSNHQIREKPSQEDRR
jgi:hypothetical protein